MTDDLEQRLAAAADALRERDLVSSRRTSLAERIAAAREEIDSLRTRAAVEQADVERLENLSLTRILASLKGSRDEDLAAERAEAQAARYRLAEAQARLQTLQAEDEIAAIGLKRLASAAANHEALMREKERRLAASGSPQGRRLLEVAEELGAVRAELRELSEARHAADLAGQALARVRDSLRSAKSWSTYDTFFGGGAISSAVKHSRLDEAAQLAAYADERLAVLRTELADVPGGARVPSLAVSSGTRFVDVWFDNIFTDLSVRDHILQSLDSVERIGGLVSSVHSGLQGRTRTAENRVAELEAERRRLLS